MDKLTKIFSALIAEECKDISIKFARYVMGNERVLKFGESENEIFDEFLKTYDKR